MDNYTQKMEAYNNVQPFVKEANEIKIKLNPIQYFHAHCKYTEIYFEYMEMVKARDQIDPKALRVNSYLKQVNPRNGDQVWTALKRCLSTCNQKPTPNHALLYASMSPKWTEAIAKLMIMLNKHNTNKNENGMIVCFNLCLKVFDYIWFGSYEDDDVCAQIVNEYAQLK
tara:strand:+ start:657 stop:1163 length:507 start_codon:yes stop_codon:yes gene_type:complete